jgi:hypothetical protein
MKPSPWPYVGLWFAVWLVGSIVVDIAFALVGIRIAPYGGAIAFVGGIVWAVAAYNKKKYQYLEAKIESARSGE